MFCNRIVAIVKVWTPGISNEDMICISLKSSLNEFRNVLSNIGRVTNLSTYNNRKEKSNMELKHNEPPA